MWIGRSAILLCALVLPLMLGDPASLGAQADTQPPTVLTLAPLPAAISQPVSTDLKATFSEAIQPATVSFVLRDSSNGVVPATVSYDAPTLTATLHPTSDLLASRTYRATVSGATDLVGNVMTTSVVWSFSTGQLGFKDSVVFNGLQNPTAFQFASDGRVFVAEKSGRILVFASVSASTPTVFADLRTGVDSTGNRGLTGLALDPGFPATPYVYVFYTYAPSTDGVAYGRLSRLQASGSVMTGTEQVLVNDWYERYPSQPVGNLTFGPDGSLYAAAGDGASATFVDTGQTDSPSPDPPNEGGALRSQDLRTPPDPVTLDGSVVRVDRTTGLAVRPTSTMTVGTPTVDANGVKSYPVTSAYQGSLPQTVRVLEPTNPAAGHPRRLLYVLPVEAGATNLGSQFSDGLEELRLLGVPNRFNMTLIAPSFPYEPWYGDNATDQTEWMESFIVRELVPWGDTLLPAGTTPQRLLIGFSKSGNGALILMFRHPNVFWSAAAWDAPAQLNDITAFPGLPLNFGTQTNYNRYFIPTLVTADARPYTTSNRLWISGDQSSWTADMVQLHSQLTAAAIPHTWVAGGTRAHSWGSGWLDGAVTDLDAKAAQVASPDPNEPRIVAYGLRSPRIAFRPGTQELWVADKGGSTVEEVNRIAGAADGIVENFGWPCYEGSATTGYATSSICSLLQAQSGQSTAPFFSYQHQQPVVAGDETVGTGAISGLAFYGSGSYPASYQGALFFSDVLRNNIWVMFRDGSGVPNPANTANFVLGAPSPVDLEIGPGGDLFYADLNGGTIRRVQFFEPFGRTGGQPSGVLPAGTTQTSLSLVTDVAAVCRFATTAGVPYGSMTNTFSTTGGTAHSTVVGGLVDGGAYSFFVRCRNANGEENPDDYQISFAIGQVPTITSPASTTLTVLTVGSFVVTTSGNPTASLTQTGTLPSGVTFRDNGNGTATLSGPAAAGTAGTYPITIRATNAWGTGTQSFTLTVSSGAGGSSDLAYVAGSVTGVVDFGGDSGTTLSAALHQVPGAGHLLVCAATWQSSTATAAMSDLNNGAWRPIGTAKLGVGSLTGFQGQMFFVPAAVNAATTVTLTLSTAVAFRAFECAAFSYSGSIAALDGPSPYSTTPASGGVATVSGLTSTHTNDLVFAGCLGVDSSCSAGTGFTSVDDTSASYKDRNLVGSFLNGTGQTIEYKAGVGTGAQSATFRTGNTGDNVILGAVAFTANTQTAPAITSTNATTFAVGAAGTFSVTATGVPTPTVTMTGPLPGGVTFVANANGTATISGTPAAGTAGTYPLTITATNGVGSPATQSFTLTVNQSPTITSAASATFAVGATGSFTITTSGTPTATVTKTGTLPTGMTFVANANGTATISGTPAVGTAATYPLTITATNGVGSPATQNFALVVNQAPAIVSASAATFTVGAAGSFTVSATGAPAPTLAETGALPAGITFVNRGDGTATIAGTAASGSDGTYAITIAASNGVGTSANQNFTLTVIPQTPPAITSAPATTFTVGATGTFTASATGSPVPTVTAVGVLPNGVSFVSNPNGTATLSGTPAAKTGGTYPITLTASNGVGTAATQSFTLTVNQAPAITSVASTAFTVAIAGNFIVTSTGSPTPAVTATGTLPNGVTFAANADGTATLSGTPAAGSAGTYPIAITATNGVGAAATQTFTLTINAEQVAPAITSASNATFTVGAAGTFTVTASGSPTPTVTVAGPLPGGVTSVANGNGTATLSGTPAVNSGGAYPITITASNGVGTAATQSFTLTVNQSPTIASATGATFTVGTVGSFTVTATGSPTPTVTATGTLPNGVSFVSNANGTATLGGTPAVGTGGTYPMVITATNGIGSATQSFTLTVNQAPAITSATTAAFTVGTAGSFAVTTTGTPTPTVTKTGTLPTGVTFGANGNGTATISGTPAAGTAGTYPITITGTNGVGTAATQTFTLTVNQAPAITSAASATFTVVTAGSFTVTATGTPTSTVTATGALPGGVTFVSNANGTATLSGTPAAGTGGTYPLTITATNGVGSGAMQSFTLTVRQAPAITSATSTAFTAGTAGSFTVTTTGTPAPTLTVTGALPGGVTFVSNGNGTATLGGTPAAGTGGTYPITITATNGVGTAATQSFTLTVRQAPAITSATGTTFTVGATGSFTVTTTGTPTATLAETGTLPTGVTFVANANGTATLSGTPAAGTAGTYPMTITANNGVGSAATQSFTLTVAATGIGASNFAYTTGSVTGAIDFGGAGTGTALSIALHQTPGSGHLLVCAATWQSSTATATMGDPNNGTWTPIGTVATGTGDLTGFRGQMFYVPAAVGTATTVTLTVSNAVSFRAFECAEFSYTGTLALDGIPQYSTAQAVNGVATVSGVTTANTSDLVLANCLAVDTACAAGTGFTGLNDTNTTFKDRGLTGQSFQGGTGQLFEFKVGVGAGAQSATFGTGTRDYVILGLVAF